MTDKRSVSLVYRLVIYSSLSVLIAVFIMGILFTYFLNSSFKEYLEDKQENAKREIVSILTQQLASGEPVDRLWMEKFSNAYFDNGLLISLEDESGEILWSCIEDNSEICSMMQSDDHRSMMMETGMTSKENSDIYRIPDTEDGEVSLITITSLPEFLYSGNDKLFLFEVYRILLLAMVMSLVIAAFFSLILSRSLTNPLVLLSDFSERLAGHDYSAPDKYKRGTTEIDSLHDAICTLSGSLEKQENLRKRLTSDISHELRTPLTTLQTSIEAMIDGVWEKDDEHLKDCHSEIVRMGSLVKDLDNLNAFDEKSKKLSKTYFLLNESISSTFRLFAKELADKKIEYNIKGFKIRIYADKDRLKQVWINLISNSIKHLPEGGGITVELETDSLLRIVFSDNGKGIHKNDLPNIFERFYQADISRNGKGSGLGLSIVKEIVAMHGGEVYAESRPGIGTSIIITLPVTE